MENKISAKLHVYKCCPVCSSTKIAPILAAEDYTVSHEEFEIWECANCSLRFIQNIPVETEIGKYYQSEEYISHSNTNKGLINRLYQVVRGITLQQKKNLVQRLSGKRSGMILDIGCGTGEFLGTMKSAGWQTKGLEPDDGARQQAISNFALSVDSPDQLFSLEGGSYDVVSMWHVLEHVHQLKENVAQIRKLLKADGTLIIAVPNYQSKDAEHYGKQWAAYDVPRHLYHFSPQAMDELMSANGFAVKDHRRMPFDAFYVSMLSEQYRHGKLRLVSAFFSGLSSWWHNLFHKKRGSSIIYVIKPV